MEEERVVGLTVGIIIALVLLMVCGILTMTLIFLTFITSLAV